MLGVALGGDGIINNQAAHPEGCCKSHWQQEKAGHDSKSKQVDRSVQSQNGQPDAA